MTDTPDITDLMVTMYYNAYLTAYGSERDRRRVAMAAVLAGLALHAGDNDDAKAFLDACWATHVPPVERKRGVDPGKTSMMHRRSRLDTKRYGKRPARHA